MLPMIARYRYALVLGSVLATGCGTYQTRPVVLRSYPGPTASYGVVCVVRSGGDADEGESTVPVWDNGVLVGATRGASHFCYLAAAGPHVVISELLLTAELHVDVRPDEHHWIEQEVGISSYHYGGPRSVDRRRQEWVTLREIPAADARGPFARTKRVELVEVPVGETLPVGGAVRARPALVAGQP
jgi:hypothetical protein